MKFKNRKEKAFWEERLNNYEKAMTVSPDLMNGAFIARKASAEYADEMLIIFRERCISIKP